MSEKPPSLRERRAQLTRDEILRAARRLFAERGYARTSVRDIAQAAGVSAQTVYDSVGSKQELVRGSTTSSTPRPASRAIARAAAESDDPRRWRRRRPGSRGRSSSTAATSSTPSSRGAAAEPELAAALAEGQRRHVEGARRIVGQLQRLDALGPAVEPDDAVETLAAVSDVRFALILRESYGWSLDRIEEWIAATSRTLLLGRPAPTTRAGAGRG